jgi:hypothetical protein
MKNPTLKHDIVIIDGPIRTEFIDYSNESLHALEGVELILNLEDMSVLSSSFDPKIFSLLAKLGSINYEETQNFIYVPNLFPHKEVKLLMDSDGVAFNEYLDSPGLVGIAFYVDELEEFDFKKNIEKYGEVEMSPVFNLTLGQDKMDIIMIRVGAVTIEFIKRVYKSR